MDRVGATFFKSYEHIRTRLKGNPVPIQLPIGAEDKFAGVIDLVAMQAIYWDDATQGMKFEKKPIPAELAAEAKEWRDKMVEAAAEANEELMNKYLESGELSVEEDQEGPAHPHHQQRDRADAVRLGVQEQGRAGDARRGDRLPAVAGRHPAGEGRDRERPARDAQRRRQRAVRRAGVQDHDRPVRRPAVLHPRLFGRAQLGRHRLHLDEGAQGAHRAPAADARQRARGNQGSARRRHRRGGRPEGRDHRRDDLRREERRSRSSAWSSRSR